MHMKSFLNKNVGEYLDLYLKSDTLLLADVFEIKIYKNVFTNHELESAKIFSAPGLAWQAALTNTEVKLE